MKLIPIGKTEAGDTVTIDVQRLIDTRMLVQANSGGGKSWMLRLLAEGIGQVVPITLLDTEGEFASLRENLDILLVGRDLPCNISTAAPLALKLQEAMVSAQVDLYDLNHQNRREYVRRFLDSMMSLPRRMWTPRVVFVDEAHTMCPEGSSSVASDAVAALMCQGRKRDFCGIMATQRLSKLDKDAAAEANNVLIGRTTLDVDQKRAGQILGFSTDQTRTLRELDEGWFYGFGPAFNHKGVFKFKSGVVKTTHGREASRATLPNPSRAMGAAISELANLAEKAKVEVLDIDAARAKIGELTRALAAAQKAQAAPAAIDPAQIEAIRHQARIDAAQGLASIIAGRANQIRDMGIDIAATIKEKFAEHERFMREVVSNTVKAVEANRPAAARVVATVAAPANRHPAVAVSIDGLSKAQARIMESLAWLESIGVDRPSSKAVGLLSRIDPTGGYFSNTIGPLCSQGLVERTNGEVRLTDTGRASVQIPGSVTLADYHARIRETLTQCRTGKTAEMFDALVANGPGEMTAEDLGRAVGVDHTGGYFSNNVGPLATLGLIERSRGQIRTTDIMFPEGLA